VIIKFYRDGVRILWWGLRFRIRWVRGFVVGIRHEPKDSYFGKWTFSTLRISGGIAELSIEHLMTYSTLEG